MLYNIVQGVLKVESVSQNRKDLEECGGMKLNLSKVVWILRNGKARGGDEGHALQSWNLAQLCTAFTDGVFGNL